MGRKSSNSSFSRYHDDIVNLNTHLEGVNNQTSMSDCHIDSGLGLIHGGDSLGRALDEVLAIHKHLEALKMQQQARRPRTVSLSLPRPNLTSTRYTTPTGLVLDPSCLNMEF